MSLIFRISKKLKKIIKAKQLANKYAPKHESELGKNELALSVCAAKRISDIENLYWATIRSYRKYKERVVWLLEDCFYEELEDHLDLLY